MSEDSNVVGGGRPPSLVSVRWQEWVQQRTVKQIVDVVPLMVEQLVDILAPLDFRVAEQVIEVPKIECSPRAARTFLGAPQTVEQLVEVPTIISYSSLLQQTLEQNVDIPVAGGGLHDFRSGQSSSSVAHSPAAWFNTEDEPFQEFFFRTFSPDEKSVTVTRHMGARVPRHVSSSTSSAYGLRSWVDDDTGETWMLLTDPALGSWWYSLRTHRSQWHPPWEC